MKESRGLKGKGKWSEQGVGVVAKRRGWSGKGEKKIGRMSVGAVAKVITSEMYR